MDILPLIIFLVIIIVLLVAVAMMFRKAGQPAWAVIVPIYNLIVFLKVAGRPWWWFFLYLIPIVSFVVSIIVAIDIAKAFGKGTDLLS